MTASSLNHHATEYSLEHAYRLGKAASLAYGEKPEIQAETKSWSFDQFAYFYWTRRIPFLPEDMQPYASCALRPRQSG
jgi:hypothetical protein